jgi:hypothetical protein
MHSYCHARKRNNALYLTLEQECQHSDYSKLWYTYFPNTFLIILYSSTAVLHLLSALQNCRLLSSLTNSLYVHLILLIQATCLAHPQSPTSQFVHPLVLPLFTSRNRLFVRITNGSCFPLGSIYSPQAIVWWRNGMFILMHTQFVILLTTWYSAYGRATGHWLPLR